MDKRTEEDKSKIGAWVEQEARDYVDYLQMEIKEKESYKPTLGQVLSKIILEHKKQNEGKKDE